MNSCHFTGWLPMQADERVTPKGFRVLTFRLMVKVAGSAEDEQLCFRVDDAEIVARCAPLLTAGRTVIVHAEAKRMTFTKAAGIVVSDFIGFQVHALEIPDRSKPAEEAKAKEQQEEANAA